MAYSYDKSTINPAVINLSLKIPKGEETGLVGYSGRGKPTLTKLRLRFIGASPDAVKIGATDKRDLKRTSAPKIIGYAAPGAIAVPAVRLARTLPMAALLPTISALWNTFI